MNYLVLVSAVLLTSAAVAQDKSATPLAKPPAAAAKSKAAPAKPPAKQKPQSVAAKLQACLEIDDATKERLNCFDEVFKPAPKPKPPAAKGVTDCRYIKEEDERLACFKGFAEKIPKLPG